MSIGHAATARKFFNAMNDSNRVFSPEDEHGAAHVITEGFTFLGEGCSRAAYLHDASGVVYKWGHGYSNEVEEGNARRLANLPFDKSPDFTVHVPVAQHFGHLTADHNTVLAMEFARGCVLSTCESQNWDADPADGYAIIWRKCVCAANGVPWCHAQAHHLLDQWGELWDMHSSNALFDALTNTYWVIDLA